MLLLIITHIGSLDLLLIWKAKFLKKKKKRKLLVTYVILE